MNEVAARQIKGFVALVRSPHLRMASSEGVGIVAQTPGALDRIEQALQTRWSVQGQADAQSIQQSIDIDRRMSARSKRDKYIHDDAVPEGQWDVDLRIDVPMAAHAAIEPRVAVAQMQTDGRLEMWVGSQDVFYQRDVVCRRLGMAEDKVLVHGCRVGGAFGGKTISTVELEAAVLAHEIKTPVKVQWTRAQELLQAFHRPPSSHRVRARLKNGQLDHWTHDFASSHILFTGAVVPAWMQKITDFIGDDGVARGAAFPYKAQAKRTGFDLVRLPVHTGPWRGLGAGPNAFAIESAMDECARVAGRDPVEFRLQHIEEPRLKRVLEQAVASAPSAPQLVKGWLQGRGVACGIYKKTSFAAVVADVQVDPASGEVRVRHMHCAHDCGRVVNPDQVRAQCEGNLVWGLGMVLVESWSTDARNFGESPIPRLTQLPGLSVHLVDHGEPPSGAGETAIVAAGAAIANAVRTATGWRLRQLPLKPGDLQRHFKGSS
jgi:isoquinoline 1-oxidoreductase beta subunit